MNLIQLVPITAKFEFLKHKAVTFTLSAILVIASLITMMVNGMNFGIDFTGGIAVEVEKSEKINVPNLRKLLKDMTPEIQSVGEGKTISIRLPIKEEAEQKQQLGELKTILGEGVQYRSVDMVGPKVGGELIEKGLYALLLSLLAIGFYIWIRFEMTFALGALTALFHDVILTLGLFSLTGLEFNLTAVAAILTIAGYSVNDTVVVYDRVRENLRKYRKKELGDLLNLSLNETFSRTILTSLTTFLAVIALAIFGGSVLGSFSYALLFGVIVGTYSSIYIAVPFLLRAKDLR
ncbi:MAG: protein translocase subunit SecF [Alphaproteobacteria bacterium]|nr:protein translocase subunit SecF [Alphaproteobacteria bacterium]MBN2779561.1 protein translocase subunit SecF [Alphaproteobacteria bacterium]